MKINQKLAALFLVTAGALSTQVNAHENAVEHIVSNLVSTAMNSVTVEIDQQVEKITLSASNLMSYDGSQAPVGQVSITDLAVTEASEAQDTKNKDSEKDNQNENTDD
jgi:hypothetical protein